MDSDSLDVCGLAPILAVSNVDIDRWWSQLTSTMLYEKQRISNALWKTLQVQLNTKKIASWWRPTKKENQHQCVFQCRICNAAISLKPGDEHDARQEQIETMCSFLRLDPKKTGADV